MAKVEITLKNPVSGEFIKAPVGYSWTVLFFGFFVPIFRGDWIYTAILLAFGVFTFGLSNIVFSFIYNKTFIKNKILKSGFKAVRNQSADLSKIAHTIGLELPLIT